VQYLFSSTPRGRKRISEKLWQIRVIVDHNDADTEETTSDITEQQLETLQPLLVAIAAFKPYQSKSKGGMAYNQHHNYPVGDCWRPDLGEKAPGQLYPEIAEEAFELFEGLCPFGEYGFHTVKRVEIWPKVPVTRLL